MRIGNDPPQGISVRLTEVTAEFKGMTNAWTSITVSKQIVMGQTNQRARTPETYDKLQSQVTIINMPIAILRLNGGMRPAIVVAVATVAMRRAQRRVISY